MRTIPVETSKMLFTVMLVEPKVDRTAEGGGSVQKISAIDHLPVWRVSMFVNLSYYQQDSELIHVDITSASLPELTINMRAHVEGLVAIPWSIGSKSGISFRADNIVNVSSRDENIFADPATMFSNVNEGTEA